MLPSAHSNQAFLSSNHHFSSALLRLICINPSWETSDVTGRTVRLPRGSSDAALAPYHVDRSKLFVVERLDSVEEVDATRIARAIEYTRFPYTASSNDDLIEEEGLLLRAADLIGQLGDPPLYEKIKCIVLRIRRNRAE
jgi:hypothetical protein